MSLAQASRGAAATSARLAPPKRQSVRPVPSSGRRRRPRPVYAFIAISGAVIIGAAQMVLSSMATEATFRVHELTAQQTGTQLQAQELYEEVAGLGSPQNLAAQAAEMGLVIDAAPSYLRLSDNAVIGAKAAAGSESTVDVAGRNAVGNEFLGAAEADAEAERTTNEEQNAQSEESTAQDQEPPLIESGLPSPSTR